MNTLCEQKSLPSYSLYTVVQKASNIAASSLTLSLNLCVFFPHDAFFHRIFINTHIYFYYLGPLLLFHEKKESLNTVFLFKGIL